MKHAFIALSLLFIHTFSTRAQDESSLPVQAHCTEEYINSIHIAQPDKALQLLDEAYRSQTIPRSIIMELKCEIYRNRYMARKAYQYAREAFLLDSLSQKSPPHLLKMNVLLAELTSSMSQYANSIRYIRQGMKWAREQDNPIAKARLLFCMGENQYALHHPRKAYTLFNRAINLLKGTRDIKQQETLSHLYGLYMGYLINNQRLQEAHDIAGLRKSLLNEIANSAQAPQGFVEAQEFFLNAKLAHICQLENQVQQARDYFDRCMTLEECRHPGYIIFTVPYLIASQQYELAIRYCKQFRAMMQGQQDTLSVRYLHALQQEIKAYIGKQAYKEAAELYTHVITISDSFDMKNEEITNLLPNLETPVPSASDTPDTDHLQTVLQGAALIMLVAMLVFVTWKYRMWHQPYTPIRRQATTHHSITEPSQAVPLPEQPESSPKYMKPSTIPEDQQEELQTNQILFRKLDNYIRQNQLYLQPTISRSDLVRKLHINNTRFARIIKENTGTNLNGYLNELRLSHAIGLLKEHPEYTLKAIAEASGIHSMPTFHQLFKDKFDMTPAEFKNRLGKDGEAQQEA